MKYFLVLGILASTVFFGTAQVSAATCPLTAGKAYKTTLSPATYYITQNCTKQLLNQDQYFSYFSSWNDTLTASAATLNSVKTDAGPVVFGPNYYPRTGSVVKSPTDNARYFILLFSKNKIVGDDVFAAMGLQNDWVETIPQATLDKFVEGETLDSIDKVFKEGLYVFHYSDNLTKTHLLLPNLKNGATRRHLLKNDTLLDYVGYRRDRIPTLHPSYQFPMGDTIENYETFFTKYFTEGFETMFGGFGNNFSSDLWNTPTTDWSSDDWMQDNWMEDTDTTTDIFDPNTNDDMNPDSQYVDEDTETTTFAPVSVKTDHIRGNVNAPITIIEYADLECPYCKMFHATMQDVMTSYANDVRWVYRHYPLEFIHQSARTEALASECAADQGKFWEMVDLIFAKGGSEAILNLNTMVGYARELRLDAPTFKQCMEQKNGNKKIDADLADGMKAGVQGTPHSIMIGPNGEIVPIYGAVSFDMLEAELQKFYQ